MKRLLYVILLLFAASLLLLAGCGRKLADYQGGEDTLCPYSWKEKRNGELVVTIDTTQIGDCEWTALNYNESIVSVEGRAASKKHSFTISPVESGATSVTFLGSRPGPLPDKVYSLTLTLTVTQEENVIGGESFHEELAGLSSGGEDTLYPYHWWTEDGALLLSIAGTHDWEVTERDDEGFSSVGPYHESESCTFTLRGLKAGNYTFSLLSSAYTTITLELEVGENGEINVLSTSEGEYPVSETELARAKSEFEALVGKISLPDGARAFYYGTLLMLDNQQPDAGDVIFRLDKYAYQYILSKTVPLETLQEQYASNANEESSVEEGGLTYHIYIRDDSAVLCWTDGQKRACVLLGESLSPEETLAIAKSLSGGGASGKN